MKHGTCSLPQFLHPFPFHLTRWPHCHSHNRLLTLPTQAIHSVFAVLLFFCKLNRRCHRATHSDEVYSLLPKHTVKERRPQILELWVVATNFVVILTVQLHMNIFRTNIFIFSFNQEPKLAKKQKNLWASLWDPGSSDPEPPQQFLTVCR